MWIPNSLTIPPHSPLVTIISFSKSVSLFLFHKYVYLCYFFLDSTSKWYHVHSTVFKMDGQQGPTVQHRELCSVLCGSLHERGVWGREDTCIWMAGSLCWAPETIIALLISCTPISNKKFLKILEVIAVTENDISRVTWYKFQNEITNHI